MPRAFEVSFDPFFDGLECRSGMLLIGSDAQTGLHDKAEDVLVAFDPGLRTHTIELGDADRWGNFSSSVRLGVDHIKTGPDHVLFVLILLLPSVLVFAKGWRSGPTFGAALWRVLKIVTMFTVAHSITFTLAGLGILPLPPSKFVEAIIAISIALAALHNIRPVFPNHEWVIAFFFGLFHGMGFASLVDGLDVGRSTQLISLLGRNVGIEIGQSVVVLLCFPALYLLRRTRLFIPGFVAVSVSMALVSIGWTVKRLGEVDFGINGFVDPVLRMPRTLYLVALGTVIAAIVRQVEANASRLLPVYDKEGRDTGENLPPLQDELVPAEPATPPSQRGWTPASRGSPPPPNSLPCSPPPGSTTSTTSTVNHRLHRVGPRSRSGLLITGVEAGPRVSVRRTARFISCLCLPAVLRSSPGRIGKDDRTHELSRRCEPPTSAQINEKRQPCRQ